MDDHVAIAFYDAKSYDRQFFDAANQAEFGYEVHYYENRLNAETTALARGSRVVCAFVQDTISAEVIQNLDELGIELIALRSAGYNNVDLKAAYKTMHVVRVPEYSPHAVAEHTVALILTLNRKTHKAYYRTRDGNFSISGLMGFDMAGKTIGIIGTGRIGRITAKVLLGFEMEILAYDPYPNEEFAATPGVTYVELDELYRRAHIISLHCPLTPDTHHIINADSLADINDGVVLVNTGRGGLIDTRALIDALKTGKVGAAGLDVYEEEGEYFFEDFSAQVLTDDVLARLLSFSNVLITSHQGFFTREAMTNIAQTTLENIRGFLAGEPLHNEICYRCPEADCRKEQAGRCF